MVNGISFKGDVPTSTPTPAPVTAPADNKIPENLTKEERIKYIEDHGGPGLKAPETTEAPALATPAKTDTVSFSGKKEIKDEVSYEKTHFFTKLGAIIGSAVGILSAIGIKKIGPELDQPKEFKTPELAAVGIGVAACVTLIGILKDFTINKTVKNTTQSVMDNLKQEIQQ